ncbi:MAG: pyrimidine 5'-nucleotidase [Kordiimonadaceae bacterium]|jgi:putative hydrolase of the HAD superfamily|nr:pyrimidine 5'-nucleotidase [Kordiimonadaceae bacterium]MBT6033471.1 pyrimidine 5'-nucleotidase [Kordiimonadaceae bacterium]
MQKIRYWVFDLDNTLYPAKVDLFSQVDFKMGAFIENMFNVSYAEAKKRQKRFFNNYGTTLRGLMTEHRIEPQAYLDFVHDIDFTVLNPDEALNYAIRKLPGEKFIYTNASTEYAQKVLSKIGLNDTFTDFFDIHDADFLPKPDIRSYHKMIDKFAIDPLKSVMIEDIAGNLNPAAELGMTTVWVPTDTLWSDSGHDEENVDYIAPNLSSWLNNVLSTSE